MFRNVLRPAAYHGPANGRGPSFEGWYYKLVASNRTQSIAIIPGVFLGKNAAESHAFVQTLDGRTGRTSYHRYPLESFRAHATEFAISIGPNSFRKQEIALQLDGPRRITGVVRLADAPGWPVTPLAPGIMGWYAWVPFMECLHGVLAFDAALEGMLFVDDAPVDFHDGRGYIEKDWGDAFPRAWIWMQSNHFARTGVSLTASIAHIPWLGTAFRGFIAGLWIDGNLYRFATWSGATTERLSVANGEVRWTLRGPQQPHIARRPVRLEIIAQRTGDQADLLHAPRRTAMVQRVHESLTATLAVRLLAHDGSTIFAGEGECAGLELGGNLTDLLHL